MAKYQPEHVPRRALSREEDGQQRSLFRGTRAGSSTPRTGPGLRARETSNSSAGSTGSRKRPDVNEHQYQNRINAASSVRVRNLQDRLLKEATATAASPLLLAEFSRKRCALVSRVRDEYTQLRNYMQQIRHGGQSGAKAAASLRDVTDLENQWDENLQRLLDCIDVESAGVPTAVAGAPTADPTAAMNAS
ncbi:unnamed protein product [Amoebophrya sp. A120]|nr:unnamed protein product [Amoebophrya sp. A120]|eukprot:GSA120T00019748001.1